MINNTGKRRYGYCVVAVNIETGVTHYENFLYPNNELDFNETVNILKDSSVCYNSLLESGEYDFIYTINLATKRIVQKYSRLDYTKFFH